MNFLYSFSIFIFGILIRIKSFSGGKARLWIKGRKGFFLRIEPVVNQWKERKEKVIWFHCSSLGEFEQGRPVIEMIKQTYPDYRILLTFFSPSGYEVRKNWDQADFVCYLPLDTPGNASRFVNLINPALVFFIKYDYWYNFLRQLYAKKIPVIIVSVLFRPTQYFFRWYGGWFRRQLDSVSCFFLQNEESRVLLESVGFKNALVTGDTRFDRVFDIAMSKKEYPAIRRFCNGSNVFIAGSTWKEDEDIIIPLTLQEHPSVKFIFAPHDVRPENIEILISKLMKPCLKYSGLTWENARSADVLIIDSIGILSQLYQYATLAYIGGGFGAGIHNIQEPVTFGVPVVFGPNYNKFKEAVDLVSQGAAFPVSTSGELQEHVSFLLSELSERNRISGLCRLYVDRNRGATEKILLELVTRGLLPSNLNPAG